MISDEQLAQLPADPELAFVQFERILREQLQSEEQQAYEQDSNADQYKIEYMNKVSAASKMYGIDALEELTLPKSDTRSPAFHQSYQSFLQDVDYVTMQIRIRSAQSNRQGSVGLNDTDRAKIHHFIAQIREIIGASELPDDKREALYNKLNKFAAEVDRTRTALQAGMAVYIAVCDGIGQGFGKLEPARKWIDSIAALLGHVKEVEDAANHRLAPPPERKRLEPPPKRTSLPAVDDEIPF